MKVSDEDGFLSCRACLSLTVILIQSVQTFAIGKSIRCGSENLSEAGDEGAQKIICRSVTGGVKGSEDRILSLGTESLRSKNHSRKQFRDAAALNASLETLSARMERGRSAFGAQSQNGAECRQIHS